MQKTAAALAGHCERIFQSRAFVAVAFAILVVGIFYKSIVGRDYVWNNVRLAPSLALLQGYEIYPGPGEGPVLDNIYGPVRALFYLPAVLAATPELAISLGIWLTVLVGLAPVVMVLRDECPDGGASKPFPAMVLCAVIFHFYWSGSMVSLWNIQADVPALAFAALSCAFVIRYCRSPGGMLPIAAAAFFAALAPWTKQTLIAFPLLPLVYLAIRGARRAAMIYAVSAFSISVLLAAAFAMAFGIDGLIFNCFTIPKSQPWQISRPLSGLLIAAQEGLNYFLLPFAVLGCVYLLAIRPLERDPGQAVTPFEKSAGWPLFFAVALCLFPMAVLGRIKVGGDINHFGIVNYFLTIAFGAAAVSIGRQWEIPGASRLKAAAGLFLGIYITAQALRTLPDIARIPQTLRQETDAGQAFRYARDHPGTVYFPWFPLASLMGERRLYHVAYGMYDREIAGFPPTEDVINTGMPRSVRYLAQPASHDWVLLKRPAGFDCPAELSGLPAWDIYQRCPAAE